MTPAKTKPRWSGTHSARIGALLGALLVFGLLAAAPASALTFEQTGTFAGSVNPPAESGVFAEEVQLGGVGGMAVNIDGVGGVPAGTLYAAGRTQEEGFWVARYQPDGDSMKFVGAWEVRTTPGAYKQCGPGGPNCVARPEGTPGKVDVDIDQTTGNVYVLNGEITAAGFQLITVFSPDGSEEITRFGEQAAGGKTAETPSQIHNSPGSGGIAVNGDGEVYVFDFNDPSDNFYHRLMVFRPKTPGNYEEYEYAGQGEDIGAGFLNATEYPSMPVTDAAGDVYVAGEDYVQKYDPDQPAAPICSFDFNKSGITAITVDPESGAPFFYSYKDKKVHQLSPCNGGKFVEVGPLITVAPERDNLSAFAFDPKRQLTSRPAGVLYGGTPKAEPAIGPGQPGRGSLGYIFAPLAEATPPVVVEESVAHVTETGAELRAEINPKGFETRYVFQYLTEAAYQEAGESFAGASEAPLGGAVLGAGQAAIAASVSLSGLEADTRYVYRAVATSECSPAEPGVVCEATGPAQSFRTFPFEVPGLPDDRAYELVSPAQKNGGQVMPADPMTGSCVEVQVECKPGAAYQQFPRQSTPDGEAIVYEGTPFDEQGAVIENQYIAHRDPKAGWQTTNLTPPLLNSKEGQGYKAFNQQLTEGLFEQIAPSLSPEAPTDYADLYLQPTSDPLSLDPLLIEVPPNRQPGTGAGRLRLAYAGSSQDFSRHFFEANDALTPDALDGGEKKNNLYEWSGGQLRLVNLLPGDTETVLGAVYGSGTLLKSGNGNNPAPDFSHAISDDGSHAFFSSEAGQVYVRINGVETRMINNPGRFLTAASDGSKVLLDNGCLYALATEACEDLTQGEGGFEGIVGHSEDLSHVYFVDTAVLDEAPNDQGDVAEAGKTNLYSWEEGSAAFIAVLLPDDNSVTPATGDWQASPLVRTARASPGGRFVAFISRAPLTGYDNTGPCQSDGKGGILVAPCREVFLYDSVTSELRCVSCNPTNARPLGGSSLRLILTLQAPGTLHQPRYLTDSGRLYFDSQDSLVLADTNEGIEDVYQYEPEGIGSCKRAEGCVSLISAGREAADSNLLAIDASGKSVFFTTRDRLKQKDKDELYDLYVAREGGGIAAETETTRSECQGEACQPAALLPNDPTPGSSSFQGSGNVKQGASKPRCPKGRRQVQRKGKPRCVKRKRARAANRNRGGAK